MKSTQTLSPWIIKHHLPENRESLERVPPTFLPHLILRKPYLRKTLLDKCNKDFNSMVLKASALETIDSYSSTWVHSYTNGSAFKATINAGYGTVINLPNWDKKEIYNSCGSFCSNYIAEQQAITNAAEHINFQSSTYPSSVTVIVIFTDNLSTIESLESGSHTSKDFTHLTWSLHDLISRFCSVFLHTQGYQEMRGQTL